MALTEEIKKEYIQLYKDAIASFSTSELNMKKLVEEDIPKYYTDDVIIQNSSLSYSHHRWRRVQCDYARIFSAPDPHP